MIVSEVVDNPRAPQQLISPQKSKKDGEEDSKSEEEMEVKEMSTVAGSLAPGGGFTAPLGLSSKDVEGPGAKGQHKKRKKPSWS